MQQAISNLGSVDNTASLRYLSHAFTITQIGVSVLAMVQLIYVVTTVVKFPDD